MTDTAPDSMTARGMMRLLVLAACLCTGTRRVTAQLTEDTPIGAGGGAGSFYFFDNAWDVPPGTRGECVGKDCQQYACTNRPEQPYCRGCSGMGGEGIGVWNVDPQESYHLPVTCYHLLSSPHDVLSSPRDVLSSAIISP